MPPAGQNLFIKRFRHLQKFFKLETGGQVFYAYTISVNVDEEIGRAWIWGRLKVADYRDGDGGGGKSARWETG
jgi:hypothetical protein